MISKTDNNSSNVMPTSLSQGLVVLLVLLLMAIPSLTPLFPRHVTPASAQLDQFSGERAMVHLPVIAREPHPPGSPAQALVRDYLVQQLTAIGLETKVQRARGVENVVARLHGTDPTGAIVVLAHYDSVAAGPGAADNGSGVAVLLEVMRALSTGSALRNDVIALFDDSEELPDPYTGTKAFVREHPWMADVRVAISLDTAIRGPIVTNETGPRNGWLVQALARAYTGGDWTSLSGGGDYDYTPFREAGIQGLVLEDNYPFKEQHTAQDLPEIVSAASVQQMGEQTLAITRELGGLDLSSPWGEHETYFSVPVLGFIHYPQAWTVPMAISAGVLMVLALGLALWREFASWRGLVVALLAILVTTAFAGISINALWAGVPALMGWETHRWADWPEVIPPYGGLVATVFAFLVLGLAVVGYILVRRWSARSDWSLAGLVLFLIPAVALAFGLPRAAYVPVWPVLIGSLGWIVAIVVGRTHRVWSVNIATIVAAVPLVVLLLPLLPAVVMSDGMKSLAILAGVWALLLGVVLPAVDGLLVRSAHDGRV
jgi:hypothetical protein